MTATDTTAGTKAGLPREAFAITGGPAEPDTWMLPHHRKSVSRALKGRTDAEKTVDWELVKAAVAALSPGSPRGQRLDTSPGEILAAARHLADHHIRAGRPLPDILAALT